MVHLKEIEESDLNNVQKYASNPEISRLSYVPSPYPENGALAWFEFINSKIQSEEAKVYVIVSDHEFAGIVTLNQFSRVKECTNIDYWVRADFHGKGIATSAVSKVIDKAAAYGIKHFNSGCLAKNVGSKQVLVKNGFSIDASFTLQDGKYQGEKMLLFKQTRT
ncbi:GNAT family N-acetyltransferase [Vibrio vulnificus]|uniref:GNAT family N-acetyltransferase n=1 Tax=Vibrio vulnificus TaxID=672 RepID=UPI0024E00C7B|nr:GNAT family N-acetyltransferase [Vibrio vulnificus]MDK2605041.1 GNAT family N-acetyltransferase [Vibrio vulnificus]MDK2627078.1 GNAT family N-acetyltransferase [Vibrio vulnificus]MDK2644647.1 GNAT family N-acetyltransferase [Vibrio vulnificus]MDK2671015.1 GNAT family N-acetyltransferase [Vibrio vulnificus]MDK2721701.1 GNAT family N-acetyltransferase [Vibrio vulnificus]